MQTYSGGIRENGFELKEGIFRVGIKINFFFIKQVVTHWYRLPREAVGALSLEAFEARLGGALGSLIWQVAASPQQGLGTG